MKLDASHVPVRSAECGELRFCVLCVVTGKHFSRISRYAQHVAALRQRAAGLGDKGEEIVRTAARELFRLMAIKDEYEVARLFTSGAFADQLAETFESHERLEFHLAPPMLSRTDPRTGRPAKRRFGPWVLPVFRMLARLKGLRGGALDVFGRTAERRMERRLRDDYVAVVEEVAGTLSQANADQALALLAYPEGIKGFGPVRETSAKRAEAKVPDLLAAYRNPEAAKLAAE